ncbi:hypothetical protein NQ318_021194 [Aromia moschata]|uniref:Uncharacterized protein n=1 Tax=Aromia moschata TaxID=1265417 RepID=A0AAV8YH96_9CUCU|nr:hypothetical protein NQ318_021194 [Aromia moschata]
MLSDADDAHYEPSVRLVDIEKNDSQCGFHLTRGKWDPYPWVSSVDDDSAAATAGVRPGDCLLEVNGEDVIGQRISEVARIVRANPDQVSLLLWNAGVDPDCSPEALCCGPLPKNLQRLSACMRTILTFLECPICLDTISPPTYQCDNGHLICIRCRTKSERCPICRLRLGRGRSLLSDQVYNAVIDAFDLRKDAERTRSAKIQQIFKQKKKKGNVPDIKITQSHTNKFLAKIIGKASKEKAENMARMGTDSGLGNRPASYHGSFEFLGRNEEATSSSLSNSLNNIKASVSQEETTLYHCPFDINCTTLIKGWNVEEPDGLAYLQDTLIWVWHLGNRVSSREHEIKVEIKNVDGDTLLSVRSSVFSLGSIGSQEIIEHRKGVFLSSKTLQSLGCSSKKLTLNITLLKCDN